MTLFNDCWSKPDYKIIRNQKERNDVIKIIRTLINNGALRLEFGDGTSSTVGEGNICASIAPPHRSDLIKILLNPEFYAFDTYVKGKWYCTSGDLVDVLHFFERQKSKKIELARRIIDAISFKMHWYKQFVSPKTETRKTKSHYNESPEFFEIMLGRIPVYSCGIFKGETMSIEEAQMEKFRLILGIEILNFFFSWIIV